MKDAKTLISWVLILLGISVLVIIGMFLYNKSVEVKDDTIATFAKVDAAKLERFNNTTVKGSEVIDAAVSYKEKQQFSVLIKTGNNTAGFYAENISTEPPVAYVPSSGNLVGNPGTVATSDMGTYNKMKDKSDKNFYVSTTGSFRAKIYYDQSGEVRLLEFTQIR